MFRFLEKLRRVPGKLYWTLSVLLLNPVTGIIAIIAEIVIAALHAEWAALALIVAGATMCWAFGMYCAEGMMERLGRKK